MSGEKSELFVRLDIGYSVLRKGEGADLSGVHVRWRLEMVIGLGAKEQ